MFMQIFSVHWKHVGDQRLSSSKTDKKKAADVIHMNCTLYTPKNKKGFSISVKSDAFRETPFTKKYWNFIE